MSTAVVTLVTQARDGGRWQRAALAVIVLACVLLVAWDASVTGWSVVPRYTQQARGVVITATGPLTFKHSSRELAYRNGVPLSTG